MNEDYLPSGMALVKTGTGLHVVMLDADAISTAWERPRPSQDPYTYDFDSLHWRTRYEFGASVNAHAKVTGLADGGASPRKAPREWATWSVGRAG